MLEWEEAGGDRKRAKEFHIVIHTPLFDEGCDNKEVLDVLPPPELHLILGIVIHLCTGTGTGYIYKIECVTCVTLDRNTQ